MNADIKKYHEALAESDAEICKLLHTLFCKSLPEAESKVWHAHPVWFLDGNPIVGYDRLKDAVRVLFWSGQSFEEAILQKTGTFKAAEIRYTSAEQINKNDLQRCLEKSITIQWDYKNIVKRKGVLEQLK